MSFDLSPNHERESAAIGGGLPRRKLKQCGGMPAAKNNCADKIDTPLGTEGLRHWQAFWLFFLIAIEVDRGMSLRDACRLFKMRAAAGEFPRDLDWDLTAAQKCCKKMRLFFGKRFEISDREGATLFACRGKGWPFVGLTDDGRRAFALVRDFLVRQQIIAENQLT